MENSEEKKTSTQCFHKFFMRKKKIEAAKRKLNGHLKQLFEHSIHHRESQKESS
jgi:hypothetical protein